MYEPKGFQWILLSAFIFFLMVAFPLPVLSFNSTFVQREVNGQCRHLVRYNNGRIISHLGTGHYLNGRDCQVTISVPTGRRIFLRFDRFDVTDSVNCFEDEVLIYDGSTISSPMLTGRLYGLCGTLPKRYHTMHSSGNEVTVRFITDDVTGDNNGFAISYVSYVPSDAVSRSDGCFQCRESSMCIDRQLMCDNLWHCPEGSDESFRQCYEPEKLEEESNAGNGWLSWTGTHLAMAFAVASVLFIVSSLVFCCCCHRPSSDDFSDSSVPRIVSDANMYYIQQTHSGIATETTRGSGKKGAQTSPGTEDRDRDVFNADVTDVMIGFPSVSMASAINTASSDWWDARRSRGDGCPESGGMSCDVYEHHHHHHHSYRDGLAYDSESTAPVPMPECCVTNMSFIEQQDLRWQYLTGQHHTRVQLPPEGTRIPK